MPKVKEHSLIKKEYKFDINFYINLIHHKQIKKVLEFKNKTQWRIKMRMGKVWTGFDIRSIGNVNMCVNCRSGRL